MKKTKIDAEKTRNDLLKAATKVFSEKGYRGATLVEIAKTAGVTRGAVYWHFEDKAQIFDELYEYVDRAFVESISGDFEYDSAEPMKELKKLWIKIFSELEYNEQHKQTLTLFIGNPDYTDDLAAYKEKHLSRQREHRQIFQLYLEKMKTEKKLANDFDAELFSEAMSCFMKGLLLEQKNDPTRLDAKNKIPQLIDWFFSK